MLDEALFGDSDGIKRIVHSYLGYIPAGIKLATGSDDGLRIVDAATGAVEDLGYGSRSSVALCAEWSPSWTKVAAGTGDRCLHIVDAATGMVEMEVSHEDFANSVAWSP